MFFLIEQVTAFVIAVLVTVTIAIAAMVFGAIQRRQSRDRYFERLDALRHEYGPVIVALLDGSLDYARGLESLKKFPGRDRLLMLERLCLEEKPKPEQVPTLRRLCEDLGLVAVWQRRLARKQDRSWLPARRFSPGALLRRVGRLEFLSRAQSAENLGLVRHQPSWALLAQALKDPHPDVRVVATRALALIGEPQSFPALVERFHTVVLESSPPVSLRTVKTALVSFPLKQAGELLPSLQHSHRRIRFLATDIIREMVEREAAGQQDLALRPPQFPPAVANVFLTQLCGDENPDVRARAAPVIAYLEDPRAARVLVPLLEDEQWFVRLHTVRALAKPKFLPQVESIAARLSDSHWMVREAAVHALQELERLEQLTTMFLRTRDRYGQEQIADEWQRAGLIPVLLQQYAQAGNHQETQVLRQLADMGKTSYMLTLLRESVDYNLHKKFLQDFGRHPDPQIRNWVTNLAARATDTELRTLAQAAMRPAVR